MSTAEQVYTKNILRFIRKNININSAISAFLNSLSWTI